MCLSSLLPPNPSIFYLHPAFLTPPQAPHLLHSLSSSPLHSTFLTFTSGPLPSISPPLSLLLPPPEPVLPHSFCSSALTLLHAPCCLSSPPWHPSYTLVFFRKLSDLFHTILSSPLASQAHGILSAPCSLAAQGPDSTISLSLPLTQLPLLPSQNKSKAAQALGADTHECSHFCRNPIPLQASLGTSLSPSARLPLLCEAG